MWGYLLPEQLAGPHDAPTQPTTTNYYHCKPCQVSWSGLNATDECWCCGQPGTVGTLGYTNAGPGMGVPNTQCERPTTIEVPPATNPAFI